MVTASKLNNDFVKYEKEELEKLSNKECDRYVEALVVESMKHLKNGTIVDNQDFEEINDLIDEYLEVAKRRFTNAKDVLLNRKFRYLLKAYYVAYTASRGRLYDFKVSSVLSTLVSELAYCHLALKRLLSVYYHNYSNRGMLNDLFFNLSTVDGLNLTWEIHEKYLKEFGVNSELMDDLNFMIECTVERYLGLIDKVEELFDVNEIAADDYFDKWSDTFKLLLKEGLKHCGDDFERTALINSGFDDTLLDRLEIVKHEILLVEFFVDYKEWFMNLYNLNNGFAELSADRFKFFNEEVPERFNDFDEYMRKEPKYDLRKFELIEPEN